MQRDYKAGLMVGLVLAVGALIWVATRPSLSPEARMARASQTQPSGERRPPLTGGLPTATPGASFPRAEGPQAVAPAGSISAPSAPANQPDLTVYELPEKIKTTRFHIVRKDETLSSISQQYFGSPNQWRKILEANKSVVRDANRLQPGTKLIIPN